ncbi:MAG: UDP-N-acetylmuramyl-tripeptide synthetase [Patescibacteria group bacterium]
MLLKSLLYKIKRPYHFVKTGLLGGLLAQIRYKFPEKKLKIICITGTDGKTTTATLLYYILKNSGKKTALITTVAAYIADETLDVGLHTTTPHPKILYKLMRKMLSQDIEYLVLEMTSHGAYQYRNWGIKPLVAGITNVSSEHLDYHLNYKKYLGAKALILKNAKLAIINDDDQSSTTLKKCLKSKRLSTYSSKDRLYSALQKAVNIRFPQDYNQMNAKLAISIAKQLGIETKILIKAIETFPGVKGRMEKVPNNRKIDIFVDFAHTANAIRESLLFLQKHIKTKKANAKVIALFGSAAERDIFKRPIMGKYAGELADLVVLTSDDAREEDIWSMIRQVKSDLGENHSKIISIADRKTAISFTLNKLARAGDAVALFGKGHEQSISIGKVEYPWDEVKVVKEILNQ